MEAKKLQLNSAEELYAEIRDKNFNAVGSVLSKKAKIISAAFEVRPGLLSEGTDRLAHRGALWRRLLGRCPCWLTFM